MLNRVKQRGLTLVELIMVMVVLAIALSGILMVMITMTNFSMTPVMSWQAAVIGDNVMQKMLATEFAGFEHCPPLSKDTDLLCTYIQLPKMPASELLKEMNALESLVGYFVSVEVVPFKQDPHMAQITVVIENKQTGKTVISALKSPKRSL